MNISDKEFADFNVEYVRFNGHNIAYINEGQGEEAVVMLHGNPGWSYIFRNLIKPLAKEYRVIVPDYLGCGRSDKPSGCHYSLEFHIDYLEQLLLSLNVQRITLVLNGWGGAIGMGFAVRHPDLIHRLIIFNSFAFVLQDSLFMLRMARLPFIGEWLVLKSNIFINMMKRRLSNSKRSMPFFDVFKSAYRTEADRRTLLSFLRDIPFTPVDESYEAMVEISHGLWMFRESKVLIVWGMRDKYCSHRSLDIWQGYYPHAEVCKFADAGYFLLEDNFDEVSTQIFKFLDVRNDDVL